MKRPARTRVPRSVPLGQYRRTLMAVRRFRLNVVFGVVLLGYGLLLGRLGQLQLVDAAQYRKTWSARHQAPVTIDARRGRIYDRNGYVLAEPKPCVSLAMDPGFEVIKDPASFALRVETLVGADKLSAGIIRERIEAAREPVQRGLVEDVPGWVRLSGVIEDATTVERLWEEAGRTLRERVKGHTYGLLVEPVEGRWYPNRSEAAHVLGRAPSDGVPGEGMEGALDGRLRGTELCATTMRDGRGTRMARGDTVDPDGHRGADAYLTIDLVLQHHLEKAVDRMGNEHQSLEAAGGVLDVRSGEILAMTSRPTFDPNVDAPTLNRVTQGLYEPGSCFKPFTVGWALSEGIVDPYDSIPMPKRVALEHDPHPVNDDHYVGDGTLVDLLSHSSNTGSAWLAHQLGPERMGVWLKHVFPYEWQAPARGQKPRLRAGTRSGLPYEKGYSRPANDRGLSWVDAHRAGFGQGFAVTPLQIASAFAAFARSDARVVRPRLVREPGAAPCLGPQVMHTKWLGVVREGLVACVEEGTARRAFEGCAWTAAGKTATSQSVQTVDERVARLRGLVVGDKVDTNLCTFVAYAPAYDPQVLVLVLARQLREDEVYGGSVAGPAVRSVIESTMRYWGVPGDRAISTSPGWLDGEEVR